MPDASESLTRRRFLAGAARAAAPLAAASMATAASSRQFGDDDEVRSIVVRAWSSKRVDGLVDHPSLLRELFEEALAIATGTAAGAEAWHTLLEPDDVIGIKFNRSGGHEFHTTRGVARMLVESLADAGWAPERIVFIETTSQLADLLRTRRAEVGWSETITDFGSGKDQFAAVLDKVTALINVPFLKTHNIAGMTGCLKNLSHGLVRHPARYHANGCLPYIADIVSADAIRRKLKLNVMNLLRAVWEGGPAVRAPYVFDGGALLVSTDPVATDMMGLEILDRERAEHKEPPLGGADGLLPLWQAAGRRGLGVSVPDGFLRRQVHL